MMSLYAANNIAAAIKNFGKRGYAQLRGLILNAKNLPNEVETVEEALKEIGTTITQYIPRSAEIYFTVEQAQKRLHRSRQCTTKIFQELEGSGLITRKKQGLGRPAVITLNYPESAKLIEP